MSAETGLTIGGRGFELRRIDDAREFADTLLRSGFCPPGYKSAEAIIIGLQYGQELGLPPMQSLNSIAVINGRPSLWGDALPALVRASGRLEWIKEEIKKDAKGELDAVCIVKRRGEAEPCQRHFSQDMAKRAGLWDKAGPWKQYPWRMLQMRARALAFRDTFADVLRGFQVREEVEDIPAAATVTEAATPERPRLLSEVPDEPAPPADDVIEAVAEPSGSTEYLALKHAIEQLGSESAGPDEARQAKDELAVEIAADEGQGLITAEEAKELRDQLGKAVAF